MPRFNPQVCGRLCLYVLKSLSLGRAFRDILGFLTFSAGIQWTNNTATKLHKPPTKNFIKRFVFVQKVDDTWSADLIELENL